MRTLILLVILSFISVSGKSQAVEDSIKIIKTLNNYLDGFYEGDSAKIASCMSTDLAKYGYWKSTKTSLYEGEAMSYTDAIAETATMRKSGRFPKPGSIRKSAIFEIQEIIASAKITAWWGTDYVLLEKMNNEWKIRMVLWQGPLK